MSFTAIENTINICEQTRKWLSQAISSLLCEQNDISEKQFVAALSSQVKSNLDLQPEGWYAPPPEGIAALFSSPNNFERLMFDTLRKPEYWPSDAYKFLEDSVGILYASPVHRASGTIGDFGTTVYKGSDRNVQLHLASCLNVLEQAAEFAEVGMQFRELHDLAQKLFQEHGLHNSRTVTWTDKIGTNLGHTIPWSYEEPTAEEKQIINGRFLNDLRNLISNKRINVNHAEPFKIPSTIAFTIEARLESSANAAMPNTFFHLIITFKDSHKKILTNFNEVFSALGMDAYIRSRF